MLAIKNTFLYFIVHAIVSAVIFAVGATVVMEIFPSLLMFGNENMIISQNISIAFLFGGMVGIMLGMYKKLKGMNRRLVFYGVLLPVMSCVMGLFLLPYIQPSLVISYIIIQAILVGYIIIYIENK